MKKSIVAKLSVIIVFLLGLGVLLYPMASNYLAERNQLKVVDAYKKTVENTNSDKLEQEYKKARKYNESLLKNSVVLTDPFDPNVPNFPDGDYMKLLALTDVMAYVEIPAISVSLPIYHTTSDEVHKKGVGHLEGTSLPIGGKGTHTALSAHSGLPTAELFTNLEKLVVGDLFYITVLGKKQIYKIDKISVVEPTDTSLLKIEENFDYTTLITCTPYGKNTHRLLVRGARYTPKDDEIINQQPLNKAKKYTAIEIAQMGGIFLSVILFLVLIILLIKQKRRKAE